MKIYYRLYEDEIYSDLQIEARYEPFDDGGPEGTVLEIENREHIRFLKLTDDKSKAEFDKEEWDRYIVDEPMSQLRRQRNELLSQTDWIITKYMEQGEPVPAEWRSYRQELRDLPQTSKPQLKDADNLDQDSVIWPKPPLHG